MREHENIWSKVSCPERLSQTGPPGYDDFVPFARRIVETFPDRVLWGTDWPHPNLKIAHAGRRRSWSTCCRASRRRELLRHKLLVDNPMRLYWAK